MGWHSIMGCADVVLPDGRIGAACDLDCWNCEIAEVLGCCPVQLEEIERGINTNAQKE